MEMDLQSTALLINETGEFVALQLTGRDGQVWRVRLPANQLEALGEDISRMALDVLAHNALGPASVVRPDHAGQLAVPRAALVTRLGLIGTEDGSTILDLETLDQAVVRLMFEPDRFRELQLAVSEAAEIPRRKN